MQNDPLQETAQRLVSRDCMNLEAVDYRGILFIGDPHITASPPGHRLDDYARTILAKLAFCLDIASEHRWLPVILGDLFHVPRNNPNHLLVDLIELFRPTKPWVLVGNHDKYEARFTRDVSLSVLHAAGVIELMDRPGAAASLKIGGKRILMGASPDWTPLPSQVERRDHDFVLWVTHHDLCFPGYESGRFGLKEIQGIDVVVNGHIHTPKSPHRAGQTVWYNPGSIVRITRSVHTQGIEPKVSLWTPENHEGGMELLAVPHQPFDEVFPAMDETGDGLEGQPLDESLFIRGLENLALRKTTEGIGLQAFLDVNLNPDDSVDQIVWELYKDVMNHEREE